MSYTDIQKASIISLIIEMINIDNVVSVEELTVSNIINNELHISQDIFEMGKALKVEYAIDVVKKMTDQQKFEVGKLLTRIIDADGDVKPVEISLLNSICKLTGLDVILSKYE
ncbi:MAG: TerB family tellurite resistance protein [Bacteroidales bacterium]|nr:TerB family tellurite resistance protein [Candidatus Sodaliphilus fimicaballi]